MLTPGTKISLLFFVFDFYCDIYCGVVDLADVGEGLGDLLECAGSCGFFCVEVFDPPDVFLFIHIVTGGFCLTWGLRCRF